MDFVKNGHVRVQAVQALAVAAAVFDGGVHFVIIDAIPQRAEARGQEAAGLDLGLALSKNNACLLFAVCQQIHVRAALPVLAGSKRGVSGHHGAFAVAGAHQDQPFTVAPQPGLPIHPAV